MTPRAALLPPPDPAEPPCRLFGGDVEIPTRVRILAGARAASATAKVGGAHLVAFDDDRGAFCRVVRLDPDGPVEVQATLRAPFRGRVTTADGSAIAGATVWAGGLRPGGELVSVATDQEGNFVLENVRGGAGVPLTVWADGFASRYRLLDLTVPRIDPFEVILEPSARVDVVFAAQVARPQQGQVELAPRGADLSLRHYPFFLPALLGPRHLRPDGTAEVVDLPDGATVEVWVAHSEVVGVRPVQVRARIGRRTRAVVTGTTGPILEGVVSDSSGAPVAGAEVVARLSEAEVVRVGDLLPAAAHAAPGVRAWTGADGAFRIARPGERGACRVEVRAPGRLGLAQQIAGTRGAVRHRFVLPDAVAFGSPVAVRVHLRAEGREVLARRGGAGFVRRSDAEPFEVRLGEPALADVVVRVLGDGGEVVEERFDALAVTGPIDLRVDG